MKLSALLLQKFTRRTPQKQKTTDSRPVPARRRRAVGLKAMWVQPPSGKRQGKVSEPKAIPPAIAPPVTPQLPTQSAPSTRMLHLSDLIRPSEQIRQSLEGFLLDQRSEHTRRAYGKDLDRFVRFLIVRLNTRGDAPLDRHTIVAYKDWLLSENLQHTTVDRHLATLRSAFTWLVDDEILEKNPAERVRFLNPKRVSPTAGLSDEEVRKLLAQPDLHTRVGALHYAVLMVLFYCGLRRSEVCSLRTSSLSKERGHHVVRLRGKGNSERVIPLVPPVWNAIRYYFHITQRNLLPDQVLFQPVRNNRTGISTKALDPSMIYYIVTRYARAAGVVHRVSPHSCRATAISNARDHQVADRAIQEFAGWSSTQMITRYDKRKTAVEDSAAHSIRYGEFKDRVDVPATTEFEREDSLEADDPL